MRKIIRPDSTTIMVETPFHLIRNQEELQNILQGMNEEDVTYLGVIVDPETYQPMIKFRMLTSFGLAHYIVPAFFVTKEYQHFFKEMK